MAVKIRDVILGGQDGLVNILGLVLGVASATMNSDAIIVSGLAGTAAESVSMAAVAYTGFKAARDVGKRKYRDGLAKKLFAQEYGKPLESALIVGISSVVGSLIPLLPFFFTGVKNAMYASVILAVVVLFIAGAVKGILSKGSWQRSGIEMSVIGVTAAIVGYFIGILIRMAV